MKRPVLIAIAVVLAAGVERTGASRAGAGDVTLFDGATAGGGCASKAGSPHPPRGLDTRT